MNLKTGNLETERSREARLQKRKEQARARQNRETIEQHQIRLEKRRQTCYNRQHHERKRAEETAPQREQRLKANQELQTPFCIKLGYLFRKDKEQRLVSGNRTITMTNIFYPYLATRSLQECIRIFMLIIFRRRIVLIRFCRQFRLPYLFRAIGTWSLEWFSQMSYFFFQD